jgi:ATP-binding cassette subfamily B protein
MSAWADAAQSALLAVLEVGMIYIAIKLWLLGKLEIGDFALLQGYIVTLMFKVWDVGRFIRKIYESLADANEMTEILVKPHEVVDKSKARVFKFRQGAIEFSKVFFTYKEGVEVLRDFDLQIKPGEKVALIGSSGGGKSTLIKLLFRFYDIQNGKIVIDGQDISAVTQDSLRKNLSLVPQDPILFHRSLMENIRYGKPEASEAEVIEASRIAHCHEFISRFPQGYETLVGERGVKLSGGERQRVAIARAVLKNAPILVLDEATSSLDSESEMLIQDALKKLMKGKTVIVVAHRLSTIMQMDRIIVIDGGRIVEEGKHKELLKAQEGIYQKLWNIQAGGFGK